MKSSVKNRFSTAGFDESVEDLVDEAKMVHLSECESSERCLQCRELDAVDAKVIGRISLARTEYREKVESFDTSDNVLCIYCGAVWDQRDHLLPRNWSGDALRPLVPTVPACAECNRTISDFPSPIVSERAMLVAQRLRWKFRVELRIPDRTAEEFSEFGDSMRKSLMARQYGRHLLRTRLHVLDLGGLPEVPEQWVSKLATGDYAELAPFRRQRLRD